MGKQKGKTQARKELPLTPRPRGGTPWDWRKCYWKAGDRVTVLNPGMVNGLEPGTVGTVVAAKKNRLGRVSYKVKLKGKVEPVSFMLEDFLGESIFWPGPPTTLIYTGMAARNKRKEKEKQ